ncbi:MAG: glycosyl transferase family 1 [Clostridiales bacterium]|nr:MAG: glycosyl transferase family 1 [Clostridiales bacterium]
MKVLIMGSPTTKGYYAFGIKKQVVGGGWVENLVEFLKQKGIDLYVCFYSELFHDNEEKKYQGVEYIGLPIRVKGLTRCNEQMIDDLRVTLDNISPDVVHIIGTEREHDYQLLKLAGAEKTVVSITGLVSVYSKHYYGGIPQKSFKIRSLGDMYRHGGPIKEQHNFYRWGQKYEIPMIKAAKYVMGRTTWDYACVKQINPDIKYFYCGEVLNDIYYNNIWDIKQVKQHSIFMSQGSYPLKGLHQLLEAFPLVLKLYPDAQINIAGPDILCNDGIIKKLKRTTYSYYLEKKLKELAIPRERVNFIGPLNASDMAKQYLSCNVFVLPSAIENSPNSLGEAMIMGVPCIASCVGGIQDMIKDRINGYVYPFDEPYMLAYYICNIFADTDQAVCIGTAARKSALDRFNREKIVNSTLQIYHHILETKSTHV